MKKLPGVDMSTGSLGQGLSAANGMALAGKLDGKDYHVFAVSYTHLDVYKRQLHYAIVDEVDSILVDEARTPLIISGQADKATDLYHTFAKIIPRLTAEQDYNLDEKARTVTITEEGVAKVENMLGVENLYDDINIELTHHMNQALQAHALMKRDRDYVVKDGQVIIVDEFTGRLMFGRRYSCLLYTSRCV